MFITSETTRTKEGQVIARSPETKRSEGDYHQATPAKKMNKFQRQNYRMIMGTIALIGITMCIMSFVKETDDHPMGWVFAGGITVTILAYVGWPTPPTSYE